MQTARPPDLGSRPGAVGRVLVVEDDVHLADVVSRYLVREGYDVETVGDGTRGLDRALATLSDVLVLDLMLPGLNGLEVFRQLREVAPVPVVMLTARGREEERIVGLELGADDHVAKPFSPRELMARVRAVLRRARGEVGGVEGTRGRAGELEPDPVSRQLRRQGLLVDVTAKEFDLLAFFMSRPCQAFRREQVLDSVWGYSFGDTTTVTVHVRRVREKVEADPALPHHLRTVRGVGYRFDP